VNRGPFHRAAALALPSLIAVTFLGLVAASDAVPPPVWEPDLSVPGAPPLQGTTWVGEAPGWAMWLKKLDDAERLSFIAGQTGVTIDPFASRPDEPPAYLSFLVVVENRSQDGIVFNPMNSWLTTNREEVQTPIGLADLSFDYKTTGRELPPAYGRIGPALLETAKTIPPGEKLSGLLIYPAIRPKSKTYEVAVQVTLPSGDQSGFSAPYRRVKTKK
jgi:hypothetical protein